KAKYRLALDIPENWEGMANGPLESSEIKEGRKHLQFAETKPFSTYVLAFTAGDFKKKTATRAGREMTMLFRESDTEKVERNADEIFDLHAASIAWMEDYTDIDMPFQKFDFALLPGFQYGGMEHIGAIFYREASLMLEEDATKNQQLGRASLIAHETAHMWFGDMVTMQWFNDVWLKEVFANFMAAKIVNPSFPEINHELRFLFAHQPSAYSEDRSEGSHPIQQELDNLKNAGTLYGRIIYQKAPVVMRQLETLVGEQIFREGLREYLQEFAYGNATWDDLINILDAKSELDLKTWSEVWVKAASMPVYESQLLEGDGETSPQLLLKAQPNPATGQYWSQQTQVAFIYPDEIIRKTVTLGGEETAVDFPDKADSPAAILPNASAIAYGYFQLDEASQEYLLANAASLEDPLLRGASWMALEEAMLRGDLDPDILFNTFLAALEQETEPLNRQHLLGRLSGLYWRYSTDQQRRERAPVLESSIWGLLTNTSDASAKSAYWSTYLSIAMSPEALDRLEAIWASTREAPVRLTESRLSSLAHSLAIKRPEQSNTILAELPDRIENPDRLRRLDFVRPALSSDVSERDAFFESLKDPENRAVEPWVGEALGYLHHPLRAESALKYIRPSLEMMEEIQATGDIFFPRSWIGATLSGHHSPEAAQIVRDFLAENPDFSYRLKNKVLMAADPVFRSAELKGKG
ncbi:MAG TPA: M1 family aminopeptidase, partial [Saprospiraceae bacterium]|nr:M1 family aminopeptidase [Saprospiraceae bacterium]